MLDDFETPWSICYPPRPSSPSNSKSIYVTVATLIMRPILGEMCVAMVPSLDKRFTSYTLEMQSTVRSASEPDITAHD
ncbi:MAG: isopenicillin-N N-acyltransferase like protein, partial [Mycobacterium sp.]|nr:isopenicillin-N N-acyltransferase like protein [Mycobacterium sp.]